MDEEAGGGLIEREEGVVMWENFSVAGMGFFEWIFWALVAVAVVVTAVVLARSFFGKGGGPRQPTHHT